MVAHALEGLTMKTAFDIFAKPARKTAPKKKSARSEKDNAYLNSLSPEVRAIALSARKLRGSFGPT